MGDTSLRRLPGWGARLRRTRLELEPDTGWVPGLLVETYRLLGRAEHERNALERIVCTGLDTLEGLEPRARIAVLSADTAQAERVDSVLAEWSSRPLLVRGSEVR